MMWILGVLAAVILLGLNKIDNDERDERSDLFHLLLFALMAVSVVAGMLGIKQAGVKSDKPIKPSIEIVCKDGKCDTTYIYKNVKK